MGIPVYPQIKGYTHISMGKWVEYGYFTTIPILVPAEYDKIASIPVPKNLYPFTYLSE